MLATENKRYKIVVNHEEQYALWIDGKDNAPGWVDTDVVGSKSECLTYIRLVWTDMRPLSLRRAMSKRCTTGDEEIRVSRSMPPHSQAPGQPAYM